MKFNPISDACIWCGRRLVQKGLPVDCKAGFGPRPRSDEHIIPANIFGKIITTDLCKCCNEFFGEKFDYAVVLDHQICEAAALAGISVAALWPSFKGHQVTPSGRQIPVDVRRGQVRPRAQLAALNALSIPISDGRVDSGHARDFAARLKKKVREKSLPISREERDRRVDVLVEKMRNDPMGTHHDPEIDERVTPTALGNRIMFSRETTPWETQWCMAKMALEFSHVLWPQVYKSYLHPCIDEWRRFMQERQCSSDGKEGIGIFKVLDLPKECAASEHRVEGLTSPEFMYWKFTFFGTIQWVYEMKHHGGKPAPPLRAITYRIVNPFDKPDADAVVEVNKL